jgi:seryl-tRNA synthetase
VKKDEADMTAELAKKVGSIGNIVHHDVPFGKDEKKNELVS